MFNFDPLAESALLAFIRSEEVWTCDESEKPPTLVEFYKSYKQWCEGHGYKPVGRNSWLPALRRSETVAKLGVYVRCKVGSTFVVRGVRHVDDL